MGGCFSSDSDGADAIYYGGPGSTGAATSRPKQPNLQKERTKRQKAPAPSISGVGLPENYRPVAEQVRSVSFNAQNAGQDFILFFLIAKFMLSSYAHVLF